MFTLVIRTAYQGKQYEFMLKEMRPRNVQTIDEMIEKNFTFYMFEHKREGFTDMEFMKR
jgi:hypothetical protein